MPPVPCPALCTQAGHPTDHHPPQPRQQARPQTAPTWVSPSPPFAYFTCHPSHHVSLSPFSCVTASRRRRSQTTQSAHLRLQPAGPGEARARRPRRACLASLPEADGSGPRLHVVHGGAALPFTAEGHPVVTPGGPSATGTPMPPVPSEAPLVLSEGAGPLARRGTARRPRQPAPVCGHLPLPPPPSLTSRGARESQKQRLVANAQAQAQRLSPQRWGHVRGTILCCQGRPVRWRMFGSSPGLCLLDLSCAFPS